LFPAALVAACAMSRVAGWLIVWTSLCCLATRAGGQDAQTPREPSADSRYEQVRMNDNTVYSGLIESEDYDWVTIIRIQTPRGQKMHLVIQPLDRKEIQSISRLDAARRAAIAGQIDEFRNRASIEAARMESIRLTSTTQPVEGNSYRHYQGEWFTLDSTADEQNTRRMIVRAEQIFAAYRQILPPRVKPPLPPRLIVLGSMEQYRSLLPRLGLKTRIENPACFLEDQNAVAIGSDLVRLAAVTGQINKQNAQLRQDLSGLEVRLHQRLQAVAASLRKSGAADSEIARATIRESAEFKKQVKQKREELRQSDQQIDRLFKKSAAQTLVRLYHEAFHAYLRNRVYPREKYDVPSWLNEGLAVIFEGGQLEGNTLRVDAPNPPVLKKLKADLAGPEPLELEKLLAAGETQFLLTSNTRPAEVDRYYAYAWGLAYYLTYEKHLLGSPALDKYLQAGKRQMPPVPRFEELTGMPLDQFQREWRDYIQRLY
jgi:hypothetical protein